VAAGTVKRCKVKGVRCKVKSKRFKDKTMAGKVQQLSDFIVTKATNRNLTITQVVNVDNATIIAAIPKEHRKISSVVLRKAKHSAIHKYVNNKTQELADSPAFKDAVSVVIGELVITQEMIRNIVIQKLKELRA